MPYYISDQQSDCAGWATVKQESDGSYTTLGCHDTKQAAIDQMVKQSAPLHSERVWAAAFAALTAALAVPEVQGLLGPWAAVVTGRVAAVLGGYSKYSV
jgi:hypothetical protein